MKRPVYSFLILVGLNLLLTGAALLAFAHNTQTTRAAQQRQGQVIENRLCTTLRRLAALNPPPGSVTDNPSRAYLQQQHAVLTELGPDVGCPAVRSRP